VLAASLTVVLASGEIVDLSYTGSATGISENTYSYCVELELPNLLRTGDAVQISIANSSAAPRSGTIMVGSTTIATLSDDGLTWH
jgi:hypothetical protein